MSLVARPGRLGAAFARAHPLPVLGLLIAAITAGVYWPALHNGFVNWDDPGYVTQREAIATLDAAFLRWAFTSFSHANWHPLTWISLAIDHALWGRDPFGYHLTNVGLHALNTGLVVLLTGLLFRRATGARNGRQLVAAAVVGAGFGLHPLHVESVAWISERKDVLFALFWLLSLLAYDAYRGARDPWRRAIPYTLCVSAFALSLMSKPMAVTLPVILLLLDVYPFRKLGLHDRAALKRLLVEKLPFLVLSGASCVVTVLAQHSAGGIKAISWWSRLWVAERALGFYVAKTLLPIDLVPYYPLSARVSWLAWDYLAALAFGLGATFLAWRLRRRAPIVPAAWAYYVVTLLPTLGLVQVGTQAAADRYLYIPILGPLALVGALAAWSWARGRTARLGVALTLLLVAGLLGVRTRQQIAIWRDSVSLWEYVVRHHPTDPKSLYNLGDAYRARGDVARARAAWERTLEVSPGHARALNQLGVVHAEAGSLSEARRYFEAALASDDSNALAHLNLALVSERVGERAAAIAHYQRFLELAGAEHANLVTQVRRRLASGLAAPPPQTVAPRAGD